MHTILVPLDGSLDAAAALPHALGFGARFSARLRLIMARGERPGPWMELHPSDEAQQHWDYLTTIGKRLHAHTQMLSGSPSEVIVQEAASLRADLIVMGSNHRQGSVADSVMRTAACPVLLVPPPDCGAGASDRLLELAIGGQYPHYSRILLPLDGTPSCERSLGPAVQLALKDRSELTLVRVLDLPGRRRSKASWKMDEAHRAYLEDKASGLRRLGCDVETRYCHEAFGDHIAEPTHTLIVLAANAKPTIGGSQLEQLVLRAHCPVLVVRGAESRLLGLGQPESAARAQG